MRESRARALINSCLMLDGLPLGPDGSVLIPTDASGPRPDAFVPESVSAFFQQRLDAHATVLAELTHADWQEARTWTTFEFTNTMHISRGAFEYLYALRPGLTNPTATRRRAVVRDYWAVRWNMALSGLLRVLAVSPPLVLYLTGSFTVPPGSQPMAYFVEEAPETLVERGLDPASVEPYLSAIQGLTANDDLRRLGPRLLTLGQQVSALGAVAPPSLLSAQWLAAGGWTGDEIVMAAQMARAVQREVLSTYGLSEPAHLWAAAAAHNDGTNAGWGAMLAATLAGLDGVPEAVPDTPGGLPGDPPGSRPYQVRGEIGAVPIDTEGPSSRPTRVPGAVGAVPVHPAVWAALGLSALALLRR